MNNDRNPDIHRANIARGAGAAIGAFIVATLGLSVAVYAVGGDQVVSSDFAVNEMSFFEVTSAAAFGVASLVMSLVMGLIGIVTAAGATIVGLAVGALGLAGGIIVTLGVVTGPILLVGVIAILLKRRFFPDVI